MSVMCRLTFLKMNLISSFSIYFLMICYFFEISKVASFPENKETLCRNANGQCVAVRNCTTAINALMTYRRHDLIRCGFEGMEEIVCCPDPSYANVNEETNGTENTNGKLHVTEDTPISRNPSTLRKSESACDEYSNEILREVNLQILEGENARIGEFPHMVAIGYTDDLNKNISLIQYKCGGSLIHKKYVLTAAHCVVVDDGIKLEQVRLGKNDLIGNSDFLTAEDYKIENLIVHPNYDRRTKKNDIALIQLKKDVKNTDVIHPACLYSKDDNPETVIATGWGFTTQTGNESSILQKVNLTLVPTKSCKEMYTRHFREITSKQICASSDVGGDTCKGDSGGPLQIELPSAGKGMFSIVGITSIGVGCGSKIPGVYTRVNKYIDWIESIIWPN